MDKFFKDEALKYIFALNYIDGLSRSKFIGMNEDLYYNKEAAKNWYYSIYNIVSECKCIEYYEVANALLKLQNFYDNMLKGFEGEE